MKKIIKKLKNNKGFSLVELLIGVAILGIIAIPLINIFIVSTNTFERSRKMGEATLVAQSIAESIEAETFSDILSNPVVIADEASSGRLVSQKDYEYVISLENLVNGMSNFDARVTFSAGNTSESTAIAQYENINSVEIAQFESMDALFAQNKYVQTIHGSDYTSSNDPDKISLEEITIIARAQGFYRLASSQRQITLELNDIDPDPDVTLISARVIYEYEYTFSFGTSLIGAKTFTSATNPSECVKTFDVLLNPFNVEEQGRYPAIFLLYHPFYDDDATTIDDIIRIENNLENTERLPIDFYVVKQKDPTLTDEELMNIELNYKARIDLLQPYKLVQSSDEYAVVHTNAGDNLATEIYPDYQPDFRWYNGTTTYYSSPWMGPVAGTSDLIPTSDDLVNVEEVYRMFDVVIEILDSDGDIIHTLNTSKSR